MEVPKPSPEAARAEQARVDLHAVLEAALSVFARNLAAPAGQPALRYLRGRGLTDETIAQFGLGWSGDGRGELTAELGRQGVTPDQMLSAGLLRTPEPGAAPREQFYGRVMFPIRDRRGRVISFGGRILGDGQPKYVNGPETALFSKRHTLYGLDIARTSASKDDQLIIVEGYLDVISLYQAGIYGAVAPLGTALTLEQLAEAWRITREPMICFDADRAGYQASFKAMELSLPLTSNDCSLSIIRMPEGDDPDTFIRKYGSEAFKNILKQKRSLPEAVFSFVSEGYQLSSPEQRAAIREKLINVSRLIKDRNFAQEFRQYFLDQLFYIGRLKKNRRKHLFISSQTFTASMAEKERKRILFAVITKNPVILDTVSEAWAAVGIPPLLDRFREIIFDWAHENHIIAVNGDIDKQSLISHLQSAGMEDTLDYVLGSSPLPLPCFASENAMPAEAVKGWWHIHSLLNVHQIDLEVEAAQEHYKLNPSDYDAYNRFTALVRFRLAVRSGDLEDAE